MAKILVLHGPNLNLLGVREPEIYGKETLAELDASLQKLAAAAGVELSCLQSNAEHELIDAIQAARGKADFILINPGAFTHTSIAMRDAFLSVAIPFIEVHLSNVFSRESFRARSYLSDIATGCITGLGSQGYRMALEYALAKLAAQQG